MNNFWIYFNNKFLNQLPGISIKDRGFLLGDGLFETLLVRAGEIKFFFEHWERFITSAQQLYFTFPLDKEHLFSILVELLNKNSLQQQDAVIRWTLTRGEGGRGLKFNPSISPSFLITAEPFLYDPGKTLKLKMSSRKRNEFSSLSSIKSTNYLENILAFHEAQLAGYNDAILQNTKGNLIGTTCANLFFIHKNQNIFTAPIADGVLPGVMRHYVIQGCLQLGIPIKEKSLCFSDLSQIEAIFATNSLIGICPVVSIEKEWTGITNTPLLEILCKLTRNFFNA